MSRLELVTTKCKHNEVIGHRVDVTDAVKGWCGGPSRIPLDPDRLLTVDTHEMDTGTMEAVVMVQDVLDALEDE